MMVHPRRHAGRNVRILVAAISGVLLSGPGHADDLSGLWATDARNCDRVFSKTGSGYSIAKDADLYGSGFIIEGRRITTQIAKCDIKSSKQDGDTTHLIASCATDVMLSNMQASFKLVDKDRILRIFPGGSDMEIPYERCVPK